MTKLLAVVYYLVASSLGLILVKQSFASGSVQLANIKSLFEMRLILGGFFYITSFFAWFFILSKSEITYIYPIVVGMGYVIIIVLSMILLGERPNLYRFYGISLILMGVLLIIWRGK